MTRKKRPRSRSLKSPPWRSAGIAVALTVVVVVVGWILFRGEDEPQVRDHGDFGDRVRFLAERRGIDSTSVRADDPIRKIDGIFIRSWWVTAPDGASIEHLTDDIEAEAARWHAMFSESEGGGGARRLRIDLPGEAFEIDVAKRQPVVTYVEPTPTVRAPARPTRTPRPEPPPGSRGRLAILLDDGGQNLDLVAAAAALPPEVAVSVLPFLPASVETSAAIHRAGHEVWLHLPLEPEDYPARNPGPGAVLVTMTEDEIRNTVRSALNNVPHVAGVNHHMGSKASADLRTMTWVMQEISVRGLAYIDSRTSVRTVAEDAARSQGVSVGRRHVFLDNERQRAAIRRQLAEAIYRARMDGSAIAIGHMARVTIEVLEDELPRLNDLGADLVPPSKLCR